MFYDKKDIRINKEMPYSKRIPDLRFFPYHLFYCRFILSVFEELHFSIICLICKSSIVNIKISSKYVVEKKLSEIWLVHRKFHLMTEKELFINYRLANTIDSEVYYKELKRRGSKNV